MAVEGTPQERLKTEQDTKLEIRAIDRELRKIDQDRLALQAAYATGSEDILRDIEKAYDEIEKTHDLQKIQAEAALKESKRISSIRDEDRKSAQQAIFSQLRREQEAAKDHIDALQKDIKLKRYALALEDKRNQLQLKQFETLQSFLGKLGGVFRQQQAYHKVLSDGVGLSGKKLAIWSSIAAVISEIVVMFLKVDEGLAKFRIYMGMIRTDAKRISADILKVATEFAGVGVNIDGAVEATKKLAEEFGGTMKISRDLIGTTAILKSQLGVAEETSAAFLRNISALSKSTAQTQRHMAFVTDSLTAAAGIPLHLVMQDVAKLSGNALALVSRMPLQLIKSAVEARKLGTTLNKMADSSAQLLNFTENVQSEMEASVLVGQSINLQLARELAYRRDIVGSTKAILAEAKRINFEKLDFFQMQAFANATGRSADELLRMIQAQRQLQEARGIEGLKDEVALYDKLQGLHQADLNDLALQRELTVKQMANQERIAALQQQWNQLLMEATRVLYPLIDGLLKVAIVLVKIGPQLAFITAGFTDIGGIIKSIAVGISTWRPIFTAVMVPFIGFANALEKVGGFFTKILGFLSRIVGLTSLFSKLSILTPFLRAVPVIGWIITGFQLIYHFIDNIKKNLAGGDNWFVAAFRAAGQAIRDVFWKPFVDVFNWIVKWWKGSSPSQVMWMVIKGIASGAAYLFDALTDPWRRFLAWVVDKIPFMGGIAKKISGGMTGALTDLGVLEGKATVTTEATPAAKAESTATEAATATVQQTQKDQDSGTLSAILQSIKQLNDNLMSGKIGLYVDGQLLSATIARQTAFRSGYGVNQVNVA